MAIARERNIGWRIMSVCVDPKTWGEYLEQLEQKPSYQQERPFHEIPVVAFRQPVDRLPVYSQAVPMREYRNRLQQWENSFTD